MLVAVMSLITTVVLTFTKLGLGLATGSLALMADGMQGLMDIIITMSTVLFVFAAAQPATATWTNGRDKLEALAALIEAAVLAVIAICIWYLAAQKVVVGYHAAEIESWHLLVVIVAIITDGLRAQYVGWVAKTTKSMALEANAAHFRTDALGSVIVLIGLVLAHQGWPVADTVATFGLAGFLSWTAWRIGRRAGIILLDVADPEDSIDALDVLNGHPAVLAVTLLRLHRNLYGDDLVARIVVGPHDAENAVIVTAQIERQLLVRPHIRSVTLAVEIAQDEIWKGMRT